MALGELVGPHAAREHDALAGNVAARRAYADHPAIADQQLLHRRVLAGRRAALPCALDERIGDVERIDLAVRRHELAAEHVIDAQQRPALLDLGGRQVERRHAEALRRRDVATDEFEAHRRQRDRHRAVLAVAGGLAGLGLERLEQRGGVLRELGLRLRIAQLADDAGRMPGGAAGEAVALEQHGIADAVPGQVVEDRGADDAAAHDDHARTFGEGLLHLLLGAVRRRRLSQVT
jgi:hypothetical protein